MNAWIVLVNRSEAKFFECDLRTQGEVRFVEKIENPKGRLRLRELDADRPGFSGTSLGLGGTMSKKQNTKDRIMQMFAKRVATRLEEAMYKNLYEELVIIAPPKFLGKLRQSLSKEVKECIVHEIPNNITSQETGQGLRDRLLSEEAENTDQGYLQ